MNTKRAGRVVMVSVAVMVSAALGAAGCGGGGVAKGTGGLAGTGTVGTGGRGSGGAAGTGDGGAGGISIGSGGLGVGGAGGAGGGTIGTGGAPTGGAGGLASATGGAGGRAATGGAGGTASASGGRGGAVMSGSGGAAGAGPSCLPGMYGGGETVVTGAKSVQATIVDEKGTAVVGQPIFIGGLDIVSNPGMTGPSGAVSIQTTLPIKKPAFKVGDSLNYAEMVIPLTTLATDFTTGGAVLTLGKLSDKPGATLTPGTSAISGDVTITLAAGASVGIDTLVYDTADKQKFRAVIIPIAHDGPWIASIAAGGGMGASLLYGVAPAETLICPAAKVTVALPHATMTPNDLGWAPGTAVEFWMTTSDVAQQYAPFGGWAKMSDGVVSADGTTAATSDGQGFVFLESFAIRRKM